LSENGLWLLVKQIQACTQRLSDRTYQLFFFEWLEQAGNPGFAHDLRGPFVVKAAHQDLGNCRPAAAKFWQSSIPFIPGIQTSNNRHASSAGNSLASNSSAL
jgi:hypothetical protein